MQKPPISRYVSGSPAIAALTAKYGDRLQNMKLYERLLTIMAIAAALSDGLLDASAEPSIEQQIRNYTNDGHSLDRDLRDCLADLDSCDETQCSALLVALIGYTAADLAQLALSGGR